MREERLFILKMLEQGKINAQEAAALLEALEAGARDEESEESEEAKHKEPAGEEQVAARKEERPEAGDQGAAASSGAAPEQSAQEAAHGEGANGAGAAGGAAGGGECMDGQAGAAGKQAEESGAGGRSGAKERRDEVRFELKWSELSREIAQQVREAVQAAMRGMPQIKEEIKENLNEVREELEQTFKEVREEIRKGPLVDVSGLRNLLGNLFGRGPSHEIEDEVSGVWAQDARPRLELRTKNGNVTVSGWDEPHYRVTVRKWVHAASEEEAKRLAAEAVRVVTSDRGIEVSCREDHRVSASIEAKVPKRLVYEELLASSTNGAVAIEGVRVGEARASTTNGAVRVRDVSGDEIEVETTNGRISCEGVHARELKASTTNGGVTWEGSALRARLRSTNGPIRLAPELPAATEAAGGEAGGEPVTAEYTAETTNAGIHVRLPAEPGIGVRFESWGRGVDLAAEEERFTIADQSKDAGWHFVSAETKGYDRSARRMLLRLKTTNGSVRLETARPRRGED